ncbi:MAG: alpha/beta hydrolase [Rickettsiales bacterium]|nr:alpha/beta hydrolase [Rickettsiales bacterium]
MTPQTLSCNIPASETIPAHSLTYYQWGNATADTVICVHGLTRNGRDFDMLAQTLAPRFHVLCPDMPGRGKSGWLTPQAYQYPTYVQDIFSFLAQHNINSCHWVGTSMGGILGLMMAQLKPGLIKSLVLNDIGCLIPAAGLKRIVAYASSNTYFSSKQAAEAQLRINCASFGIRDEAHWNHLFTHSIHEQPDGTYHLAYDPAILAGLVTNVEIQDVNLWPFWPSAQAIPTLLIRGKNSDLLTAETALQMQQQHPNLELLEIAECGHAPTLMADEQTHYIENWLRKRS